MKCKGSGRILKVDGFERVACPYCGHAKPYWEDCKSCGRTVMNKNIEPPVSITLILNKKQQIEWVRGHKDATDAAANGLKKGDIGVCPSASVFYHSGFDAGYSDD